MSRAALDYVSKLLEDPEPVHRPSPGARAVLWPVARRANRDTGATYAGRWLSRASGLSPGSVRRYLHMFERWGWIRLDGTDGKALRVTFPVVDTLAAATPAGRTDAQGQWHPAICGCPECREMTA